MDRGHGLSLSRQCRLLEVNRSSLYYAPRGLSEEEEELMKLIDRIYMKYPFKGSRKVVWELWDMYGIKVDRKRVMKLMRVMGLREVSWAADDSAGQRGQEVWAADITYIPMRRGLCI